MSHTTKTIPADRLYWAVLDLPPGLPAGTQILKHTEELDQALVEFLSVPIETVKTAYMALDDARVLAVALPREQLAELTGGDTMVVAPEALPQHLQDVSTAGVPSSGLNLLWGDLEAKPVVAAKRHAVLTAAAVIILLTAVALLGLERRTAALQAATVGERSTAAATLNELYHKSSVEAGTAALDQELSRLVRTRAHSAAPPADAADALQLVLTAWPRPADAGTKEADRRPPRLRTESLTVTPGNLNLTVAIESREQAAPLSEALSGIAGWKLFQPQFVASPNQAGAIAGAGADKSGGGMLSLHLAFDAAAHKERPPEGGAP